MIQGAVNRPVLTAVGFIILVIIGIIGWINLPVSLYPDITLPTLMVVTQYNGASALDIEEEVSKELEEVLSTVSRLETIESDSRENISLVSLEFEYGTDLDEAANNVRDALGFASLPEDAEDPRLFKLSASMAPVVAYTVTSDNPGIDVRTLVEDKVLKDMARVSGVGSADFWGGGKKKQINVKVSKLRMEQTGVSLNKIVQALQANNINIPLGDMERGDIEYTLRLPSKFSTLKQIEDIIIGNKGRSLIHLRDVATVDWGSAEKEGYFRKNGTGAVLFGIFKKSGANTVEVSNGVREEVKNQEKIYPSLEFDVIFDLSTFVKDSINNLIRTISIAILLVLIVSFLLLGNIRASVIIALVIPVSLIISLIYLFLSDSSLNIVSLSAIAIAVGMVVDNAVVVLENVFRHRESGETRKEASIFGAQEVGQAILASTITTIVIFLPLLLTRGLVSVMFKELAITIPLMLGISFITALTLSPMLSSRFLQMKESENFSDKLFGKLENGYSKILDWSLSNKGKLILIFTGFFILGVLLLRFFVPLNFFPTPQSNDFQAEIELPTGSNVERTNRVAGKIENLIWEEYPQTENLTTEVGGGGGMFGGGGGPNIITMYGEFDESEESPRNTLRSIEEKIRDIPGVKRATFSIQSGMMAGGGGAGPFGGAAISLEIIGDNIELTDSLAGALKSKIENVVGIRSIEISRKKGAKELWLSPRYEEMQRYGFSSYTIGSQLRTAFYGTEIGKFSLGGVEYPIVVSLDDESKNSPRTLDNLKLTSPMGYPVHISNIFDIQEKRGPTSIERKNGERLVKLNMNISGSLGPVLNRVREIVDAEDIPEKVRINYGGQAEEQAKSVRSLLFAIALGIILVYLVMSAQFESFFDPFIIMFSVPFAFVGVALAYFVSFQALSMMGMVGVAMLVGIVVNNAIVMIDYFNILRKRGTDLEEAVRTGGRRRLRPILMTTGTTVFGLLPLALSTGAGAELWRSLGISVVGGMIVASFVTLLLIPVLYSIFESKLKRRLTK